MYLTASNSPFLRNHKDRLCPLLTGKVRTLLSYKVQSKFPGRSFLF